MDGIIPSEHELLARFVDLRISQVEGLIMATKAETEKALDDLATALTDYSEDVTATLAEMTTKLDAALANDAADAAQLAELKALTDTVVARTTALTEAVRSSDQVVDRP